MIQRRIANLNINGNTKKIQCPKTFDEIKKFILNEEPMFATGNKKVNLIEQKNGIKIENDVDYQKVINRLVESELTFLVQIKDEKVSQFEPLKESMTREITCSLNDQTFSDLELKRNKIKQCLSKNSDLIITIKNLIKESYGKETEKHLGRTVKAKSLMIIHPNTICKICNTSPIVGYRYKCSYFLCMDYNLCERCFANNDWEQYHPHDFFEIREPLKEKLKNSKSLLYESKLLTIGLRDKYFEYPLELRFNAEQLAFPLRLECSPKSKIQFETVTLTKPHTSMSLNCKVSFNIIGFKEGKYTALGIIKDRNNDIKSDEIPMIFTIQNS